MIPMPDIGGKIDLDQIAPVNIGRDFALYFLNDTKPAEVVLRRSARASSASAPPSTDIAKAMG